MSTKREPVWMALATHLASYIRVRKRHHLQVYVGDWLGDPAAIVRLYVLSRKRIKQADGDFTDDSFLKCTMVIGPDEAALTDHDLGIRFVDLRDPKSCDQILAWMVKIGITPKKSRWRDPV